MRKVKRWRYYCDFCKKSGGSSYHLQNHERGCTANPDRKCGLCAKAIGPNLLIADLIAVIGDNGEESLIKLREITENCPACILAAIRQSKINEPIIDEKEYLENPGYIEFDFKKELGEFWSVWNDAQDPQY